MRSDLAVLGATGLVGREIVSLLEERDFPLDDISFYASSSSAGNAMQFQGQVVEIEELNMKNISDHDIFLSSLPGEVSSEYLPRIRDKCSGVIIDNSSAFRMEPEIPLVVPEINSGDLEGDKRHIANPNCSTIQMVMVLKPLLDEFGIELVIASTYQSVSGSGAEALEALEDESRRALQGKEVEPGYYRHPIAFNLLPDIDYFHDDGFSQEEIKMRQETRKILHRDDLSVNCTCVRVPVKFGHAESVYLELSSSFSLSEVNELLERMPGVAVEDDPAEGVYPTPLTAEDSDKVFVGRMRRDRDNEQGLHLYIVADNIRKGAALNAVQIAEELLNEE